MDDATADVLVALIGLLSKAIWPALAAWFVFYFRFECRAVLTSIETLTIGKYLTVSRFAKSETKTLPDDVVDVPFKSEGIQQIGMSPIQNAYERRILNTLWIQQVNRKETWPISRWMFRPAAAELPVFYVATERLMNLGLVALVPSNDGTPPLVVLTEQGWEYCKAHWREFDAMKNEQWFPKEPIDRYKLESVVGDT